MKITLINPPSIKDKYEHGQLCLPKIGIAYISAFLEKNGIDCSIIDAKFERISHEELSRRLKEEKPDLAGISAMTSEIKSGARVAGEVKKILPGCKTVVGGAHAISIPYETMLEFSEFDFLVSGEGEETMLDLVQTLRENRSLDTVQGLLFRQNGDIKTNTQREWIEDLDSLPFPAWHKYPEMPSTNHLISSRGCPFSCSFCKTILGKKIRNRSPENVVDEIEWLADKHNLKEMIFIDETFTLNLDRTNRLLDLLIERGLDRKVKWVAQTRVDRVDKDIFYKLKKAGCFKIEFGVESGNQKILGSIKKKIKLDQVVEAVRLSKKAGLKVGCSFILGHPHETRETVQDTIDFAVKLNPDIASFGIMVPLPGTEIYDMAVKGEGDYIFTIEDWDKYIKFGGGGLELRNLSRKELEKLQVKGILSFYLKNFRFIDFISYGLEHRKQAMAVARKLLKFKKS